MNDASAERYDYGDDYDKEAHDCREMLRRLAMTPAERVRDNAAAYRVWVIGQKNHARMRPRPRLAGQSRWMPVPDRFDFEQIVEVLNRHQVDYIVIGGMAAVWSCTAHQQTRLTLNS